MISSGEKGCSGGKDRYGDKDERDRLGAVREDDGTVTFLLWAPKATKVELELLADSAHPNRSVRTGSKLIAMTREDRGYFRARVPDLPMGTRYGYRLDGGPLLPDPASRSQPDGVHGSSAVVASPAREDRSDFVGPSKNELVIYELHVGTFTERGTFDAVIPELPRLARLGVTAIEIMPVSAFPGTRNWGYDGVCLYAVQASYGGPVGLRRLVDACHAEGLSLILDVVYNHLGPEGNYLSQFGHYFTDAYHTPWGSALNFDGPWSDEVRRFFIEQAVYFFEELGVDGFRLDAVHAILDRSAYPFLEELADRLRATARFLNREVLVIAESDQNDPRLLVGSDRGGYGLDATWCDDLHHAVHALLTGERAGYYRDFGDLECLGRVFEENAAYAGQYSEFRHRRHGRSLADLRPRRFVTCVQNHDQVGNRMKGERLITLAGFEAAKLAAAVNLLSPFTPLLFMGEEWGEQAPFLYFVNHGDEELSSAVRRGREKDFVSFGWREAPPDPASEETFLRSRIGRDRDSHRGRAMAHYYRELLRLRRELDDTRREVELDLDAKILIYRTTRHEGWFHFGKTDARCVSRAGSRLSRLLDSADAVFAGDGSVVPEILVAGESATLRPRSAVVWATG